MNCRIALIGDVSYKLSVSPHALKRWDEFVSKRPFFSLLWRADTQDLILEEVEKGFLKSLCIAMNEQETTHILPFCHKDIEVFLILKRRRSTQTIYVSTVYTWQRCEKPELAHKFTKALRYRHG